MLRNLGVAWSLASFPVRALYAGYRALAWVFDAPAPMGQAAAAPGLAPIAGAPCNVAGTGEVPSPEAGLSRGARENLLRFGFVSSTLLWIPAAYGAAVAAEHRWLTPDRAWVGFAWVAAAAWVTSVMLLRRAGRKAAKREYDSPLARARRAVGAAAAAVKDAPGRAAGAVGGAVGTVVASVPARAASVARSAASRAVGMAGRCVERARARVSSLGTRDEGRMSSGA